MNKEPSVAKQGRNERCRCGSGKKLSFPDPYEWERMPLDEFQARAEEARGPREFNALFWRDQARQIEAYSVMTFWRLTEVLESAVLELRTGRPLSAAILARSALELAVAYLDNSISVQAVLREVVPAVEKDALIDAQEFEEMLLRTIFGSREAEVPKHLQQTNVMTQLQRVAKLDALSFLPPLYARLCELAHPNRRGNELYWVASSMRRDNVELLQICRDPLAGPAIKEAIWDAALALVVSPRLVRQAIADNQSAAAAVLVAVGQRGRMGPIVRADDGS